MEPLSDGSSSSLVFLAGKPWPSPPPVLFKPGALFFKELYSCSQPSNLLDLITCSVPAFGEVGPCLYLANVLYPLPIIKARRPVLCL